MGVSTMKIGFVGLLQILFIALKLTKQIDWSWIWVMSPVWGTILLYPVIFLGILFGAMFFTGRR